MFRTKDVWIGLNDDRWEGAYRDADTSWVPAKQLADRWDTNEPDPTTAKNCVIFQPSNGKLAVKACTDSYAVLCQIPANEGTIFVVVVVVVVV